MISLLKAMGAGAETERHKKNTPHPWEHNPTSQLDFSTYEYRVKTVGNLEVFEPWTLDHVLHMHPIPKLFKCILPYDQSKPVFIPLSYTEGGIRIWYAATRLDILISYLELRERFYWCEERNSMNVWHPCDIRPVNDSR